jgi:hypothetical protein
MIYFLRAGVFSIRYQNGFLRHISYGDLEVVRMIYMALRDQNWTTYEPIIENEKVNQQHDSFTIHYDCYHELAGKRIFHWHVAITGSSDSVIAFEIQGEALADVLKNRAGICVLHPIHLTAGQPCELIHTNGDQIKKSFPVFISCENPFKNLKAFRWRCQYDWFTLRFEGDAFETEDQRNWSDTSYKTFCTPLDKPFPVQLLAGDTVHQKVFFQAEGDLLPIVASHDKAIEITALEQKSRLPFIGIAASTETETLSEENIQALHDLKLNHYRIEVQPSQPSWENKFIMDCSHAGLLKLPLEIALHISDLTELTSFYETYLKVKPEVQRIILLSVNQASTEQSLIDKLGTFRKLLTPLQIGAGTDYNFRELNCNRFNADFLDFISYSIDPQEHAIDDLTIIENIQAQADTVRSAQQIYGESKAIHVSSLTLKRRFNPAATVSKDKILSNEQKADPRLQTPFAAAFTLGSIKSLSTAGAQSVTLYQTIGKQGVVSESGDKYPVYHILKEILSAAKLIVVHTESSQPIVCDSLLLSDGRSFRLILVNYSTSVQRVVFTKDHYTLEPFEIRVVDIG